MISKLIKILFILASSSFIIIPLFFTDYRGGAVSETEKRYLATGPITYTDNFTSINFKEFFSDNNSNFSISKWIDDNIGFRKEMITYKAYLEYVLLHKSPTPNVEIGKDGFLYFTPFYNMYIPSGQYPLDNYRLRLIKKNLLMVRDILAKYGVQLVVALAPSKTSIYPEYVRYNNYKRIDTPIDIVDKYVSKHINYINLKSALYEEKSHINELLYYKTDTHWNPYGAYIAYKAIIDNFKNNHLLDTNETYVPIKKNYDHIYRGELLKMMGFTEFNYEKSLGTIILDNTSREDKEKDYIKDAKSRYRTNTKSDLIVHSLYNNNKSKKILIYSDSMFFDSWNFPYYLSSHFKEYHQIVGTVLDIELIKSYKPDILLIERIETLTFDLPNLLYPFIYANYNAKVELSSPNLPLEMIKGQRYSFDIHIKNISEFNIGYDYMTILGVVENKGSNNIIGNNQLLLSQDVLIKPGEQYILHIDNFIPNFNSDSIEIKAGEEDVRWISNGLKIRMIQ